MFPQRHKGKLALGGVVVLGVILLGAHAGAPVTLDIGTQVAVHPSSWMTQVSQFEKENPEIKIRLIKYSEEKWFEQAMVEASAQTGLYDLMYFGQFRIGAFKAADYIYPLTKAEFDLDKLNLEDVPGLEIAMENGVLYLVPYMNEIAGIVYRRDLVEDPSEKANFAARYGYELAPPKTLDEYRDFLEFFTRPDQNLYGVALFGERALWIIENIYGLIRGPFKAWFINYKTLKPDFNHPEGWKALRWFKRKFLYADPACSTWDWHGAQAAFFDGRAAALECLTTVQLYANDPKMSKVTGKVAWAPWPLPEGRPGPFPAPLIQWGFYMTKNCKDKQAAFKWLTYVTDKETMVRAVTDSELGNIPARYSVLEDPRVLKRFPWIKDFTKRLRAIDEAELIIGFWAPIPQTTATQEIVQKYLSLLEIGELTVKEMAAECEQELLEVLER